MVSQLLKTKIRDKWSFKARILKLKTTRMENKTISRTKPNIWTIKKHYGCSKALHIPAQVRWYTLNETIKLLVILVWFFFNLILILMCYPNQLLSSNVQHIINFNVSILKKYIKTTHHSSIVV